MNEEEVMATCLRKESKQSRFDSHSVRYSVLIISHITFRDCGVQIFSDNLSRNTSILNLYNDDAWKRFSSIKRHCKLVFAESWDSL